MLTQCDLGFSLAFCGQLGERKHKEWSTMESHTLYLSLICHWLFLLHLTGKAKHGLWFSAPSTGALTDPPAVILDFMSAVPESQPQLIQGHSTFYYFILENRSQPVLRHCAMLETAVPSHYISVIILPVSVGVCYPYVYFSDLVQ